MQGSFKNTNILKFLLVFPLYFLTLFYPLIGIPLTIVSLFYFNKVEALVLLLVFIFMFIFNLIAPSFLNIHISMERLGLLFSFVILIVFPIFSIKMFHRTEQVKGSLYKFSGLPTILGGIPLFILIIFFLFLDDTSSLLIENFKSYLSDSTSNPQLATNILEKYGLDTDKLAKYIVYNMPILFYSFICIIMYSVEKIFYRLKYNYILDVPIFVPVLTLLGLIGLFFKIDSINLISFNVILSTAFIYFLRGLDIIRFRLINKKVSSFILYLYYIILFFISSLMIITALVGFLSIFRDFLGINSDGKNSK